jgi:hypothetical protein
MKAKVGLGQGRSAGLGRALWPFASAEVVEGGCMKVDPIAVGIKKLHRAGLSRCRCESV